MRIALILLLLTGCGIAGFLLFLATVFYLGDEQSFQDIQRDGHHEMLAGRYLIDFVVGMLCIGGYLIQEWLVRFFSEAHYPIGCRNVRFRIFVAWVCLCVILLPTIFWGWLQ